MKEYQQKHMMRTMVYSKTTIVILFVIMVLLIRSIVELHAKSEVVAKIRDETAYERKEAEGKVLQAKERNEALATPRGFESYVRTTYPVVQEGEGVIVVYDEKVSPVVSVREDITFWEKVTLFWQKHTTSGEK